MRENALRYGKRKTNFNGIINYIFLAIIAAISGLIFALMDNFIMYPNMAVVEGLSFIYFMPCVIAILPFVIVLFIRNKHTRQKVLKIFTRLINIYTLIGALFSLILSFLFKNVIEDMKNAVLFDNLLVSDFLFTIGITLVVFNILYMIITKKNKSFSLFYRRLINCNSQIKLCNDQNEYNKNLDYINKAYKNEDASYLDNINITDNDYAVDASGNQVKLVSYYKCNIFVAVLSKLGRGLLLLISLTILLPFTVAMKQSSLAKHTVIDNKKMYFDGNGGQLIGRYVLWMLLCIPTLGIFAFFIPNRIRKWKIKHTHLRTTNIENDIADEQVKYIKPKYYTPLWRNILIFLPVMTIPFVIAYVGLTYNINYMKDLNSLSKVEKIVDNGTQENTIREQWNDFNEYHLNNNNSVIYYQYDDVYVVFDDANGFYLVGDTNLENKEIKELKIVSDFNGLTGFIDAKVYFEDGSFMYQEDLEIEEKISLFDGTILRFKDKYNNSYSYKINEVITNEGLEYITNDQNHKVTFSVDNDIYTVTFSLLNSSNNNMFYISTLGLALSELNLNLEGKKVNFVFDNSISKIHGSLIPSEYETLLLNNISFNDNITYLPYEFFKDITFVNDTYEIPSNITDLGDNLFNGTNIKKLIIPNTVTDYSNLGNVDIEDLTLPFIPNDKTLYKIIESDKLTRLTLNGGVATKFNNYERDYFPKLNTYIFNNITSIYSTYFDKNDNITINGDIENIGSNAFSNITIDELEFNNIKNINRDAFYNCNINLININSVENISFGAFDNCTINTINIYNFETLSENIFNNTTVKELLLPHLAKINYGDHLIRLFKDLGSSITTRDSIDFLEKIEFTNISDIDIIFDLTHIYDIKTLVLPNTIIEIRNGNDINDTTNLYYKGTFIEYKKINCPDGLNYKQMFVYDNNSFVNVDIYEPIIIRIKYSETDIREAYYYPVLETYTDIVFNHGDYILEGLEYNNLIYTYSEFHKDFLHSGRLLSVVINENKDKIIEFEAVLKCKYQKLFISFILWNFNNDNYRSFYRLVDEQYEELEYLRFDLELNDKNNPNYVHLNDNLYDKFIKPLGNIYSRIDENTYEVVDLNGFKNGNIKYVCDPSGFFVPDSHISEIFNLTVKDLYKKFEQNGNPIEQLKGYSINCYFR